MFTSVSFAAWNQAEINRIFNDVNGLPFRCITPSSVVPNSHITAHLHRRQPWTRGSSPHLQSTSYYIALELDVVHRSFLAVSPVQLMHPAKSAPGQFSRGSGLTA